MKLQKKLIFKKFRIKKLICNTHSAIVYEGINELNKEEVALKFEKISSGNELLESEAYLLYILRGFGIPRLISYGKISKYNVLIEELLGKSLYNICIEIKNKNKKIKLNDICLTAIQCIDRLEFIHSKDIIHRDIKPFNFMIGKKYPDVIYLIDFGIAKKYRSSRTGKHIKYSNIKLINGSLRYMSINANKGYEQSRRDDLEALGYMLIFLAKNNLPWVNIEKSNLSKLNKCKKICDMKQFMTPKTLCEGLPEHFSKYINYCRNLEFEQKPNYNYLRQLFIDFLIKNNDLYDYRFLNFLAFSWIKKNNLRNTRQKDEYSYDNKNKYYYLNRYTNFSRKKENCHQRLYRKVKNSIEKARSQDLPNLKSSNFFMFGVNNNIKKDNDIKNKEKKIINIKNIVNNSIKNYNNLFNISSNFMNNNIKSLENNNNSIEDKYNSVIIQKLKKVKPKLPDKGAKILKKPRNNKSDDFCTNFNFLQKYEMNTLTSPNNESKYINSNYNLLSDINKAKRNQYKTLEERENIKLKSINVNSYNTPHNIRNSNQNRILINHLSIKKAFIKKNNLNSISLEKEQNNIFKNLIESEKKIVGYDNYNNTYNISFFNNSHIFSNIKNKDSLNNVDYLIKQQQSFFNNYNPKIKIAKNYNINIINN